MKRTLAVVIVALCSVLAVGTAAADVPPLVLMEGRLADDQGQPVDGDVTLSFQFFTQEVDGEPLAVGDPDPNAEVTVPVTAGVFRQWLALPSETLGAAEALWVEVMVHEGQDSETMTPRLEVVSVPYALRSGAAFFAEECGECITSQTCSCTLDDFDLTPYATITWVEGMCVTEEDLLAELADYCKADEQGQCGDFTQNDVQVYLTENGYLKLPGDEDILLAFLADNGFNACECYGDTEVAAFLLDNDYHPGPHYSETDTLAYLDQEGYEPGNFFLRKDGSSPLEGEWDLSGYPLLNIVIHNAASAEAPDDPSPGQLYWDTSELVMKVFSGADWEVVGTGAGGPAPDVECNGCVDPEDVSFAWALADAPGGVALFAANSNLLDGMDSSEFEAAGTAETLVGQHESDWGHLSVEAAEVLTGGPSSTADAFHTHSTGGFDGLDTELLSSTYSKKYWSTDTPKPTPLPDPQYDFYSFQSVIEVPDAGKINSLAVGVNMLHGDLNEVKLELSHLGQNVLLADEGSLDGDSLSIEWKADDIPELSSFVAQELAGDWSLQYTDGQNPSGNAGALLSWYIVVEYVSSETLTIKGNLVVEGSGLHHLLGIVATRNSILEHRYMSAFGNGVVGGGFGNPIIETYYSDTVDVEPEMIKSSSGFEYFQLGHIHGNPVLGFAGPSSPLYFMKTGTKGTIQTRQFPSAGANIETGVLTLAKEVTTNIDAFDDGIVDNNWVSSGSGNWQISESESSLYLSSSAIGGSAKAYWVGDDYYQTTKTVHLMLRFGYTGIVAGGGTSLIIVDDSGGGVGIDGGIDSNNQTTDFTYRHYKLKFDGVSDVVYVWRDGLFFGEFGLSTIAGNHRRVGFGTSSAHGMSNSVRCYLFSESQDSYTTTFSGKIRLDGSNWNSATDVDEIQTYSSPGVNPEIELTVTRGQSEAVILYGHGFQWE